MKLSGLTIVAPSRPEPPRDPAPGEAAADDEDAAPGIPARGSGLFYHRGRMAGIQVSVIGAGRASAKQSGLAEEVGRLLAERGCALVCGGLGGVMEAAARGARRGGRHDNRHPAW